MKPLILITNDDGIDSPGLAAAIKAMEPLGELLIAAPNMQQSSMSRAYPKIPELGRIEKRILDVAGKKFQAFAIHGSPAYCVSYAVLELADRAIDLCVSGINYGENIGLSLLPSGTIGAAFEADTYNIPSIAASLQYTPGQYLFEDMCKQDWGASIHCLQRLAQNVLHLGYCKNVGTWNLNIPTNATIQTPWKLTRQSRQNYYFFRKPQRQSFDQPTKLKVEVEIDYKTLEPDSDIQCLILDKCVSVSPLNWDLTSHISTQECKTILQ